MSVFFDNIGSATWNLFYPVLVAYTLCLRSLLCVAVVAHFAALVRRLILRCFFSIKPRFSNIVNILSYFASMRDRVCYKPPLNHQ